MLRTAQTHAPWARDLKYRVQWTYRELMRRPFDKDLTLITRMFPQRNPCVIDIGANRGQTVQAVKMLKPHGIIMCFEPSPETFSKLKKYVSTYEDVTLYNVGLGDQNGEMFLHTPIYNGYSFDGLASCSEEEARNWLNQERILGFSERKLVINRQYVPIRRLDEFDFSPDFIKIDVQGYELPVLMGGMKTITLYKPAILLEDPREDREGAFLSQFDYRPFHFQGGRFKSGFGGRNTFFLQEEQYAALAD